MAYHVMTQIDGNRPRFEAAFDRREDAFDLIKTMGGAEDDTAMVPGLTSDDDDTLVYNLGRDEGCPIAWIEEG